MNQSQLTALEHFAVLARGRKTGALRDIDEILRMSNLSPNLFDQAVHKIKTCARVALHFHPDRPDGQLRTVAEGLFESGIYKSQFATGMSNGSVSAFAGGARDGWEEKMFGGAYHRPGADLERPKYGALDLLLHGDGPAPRFGSCYFLLSPALSPRCTFTYLDSHQDPIEKGTLEEFDDILAALFKEVFTRDFALGEKELTPPRLVERLLRLDGPRQKDAHRNLNHYIECQIHGPVSLSDDAEVLIADPSFKDQSTGRLLQEICRRNSIELDWHQGFSLAVGDVPSDFRGPTMPSLAQRVAKNGRVDAHCIGLAANDLKRQPESWADRGAYPEVLQELKLLWHVLVQFG